MSKYCLDKGGYALYLDCQECDERICECFACLVVGSRTFDDYELLKNKLDHALLHQDKVLVVSGGARGADSLAERYAAEKGYPLRVFPARWDELGKSAGYIRNREMHEFLSHAPKRGCCAFWDGKSKGTAHNFDLCREFNTPIRIFNYRDGGDVG